jgi:hypothetical protein
VSGNRERVYFASHERPEGVVDHAMSHLERLTCEARRHDRKAVVPSATGCPGVPDVLRGFVFD